tara:strand:- start:1324 stop:1968 length:645 start_codon:yes stop_codon:yes gene_type:complete
MKVYCDGCSWIKGAEIEDKTKKFSTLICNEIGAEEVLAVGGETGTNWGATRRMLNEYDISEFGMAIIQFAVPSRNEYYDSHKKKFLGVGSKLRFRNKGMKYKSRVGYEHWDDSMVDFWRYYYTNVYHPEYGETYEQIQYNMIKNHCAVNNVPLLFLTTRSEKSIMYQEDKPRMNYDFYLDKYEYPRVRSGAHPNEEGHRMIANDLLKIIHENLL